jgi:hypothetical protein
MKILFVGNSEIPWSTNVAMERELKRRGHTVVPFNYRTIARNYAGAVEGPMYIFTEKLGRLLRKPLMPDRLKRFYCRTCGRGEMSRDLVTEAREGGYGLVFLAKAGQVDWEVLPEINEYARTWYWFMDPMATALEMNAIKYAERCTWASSTFSNVADYFRTRNFNSHFITEGFDLSWAGTIPKYAQKETDVIFVGAKDRKRARYIDYLKKNGVQLLWHGPGADQPPVYLEEMAEKYRKSKIILNFSRDGWGFSDRVFQGAGLGCMILTEYCRDAERLFERGKHLDWFTSEEDCLDRIRYYLDNDELRERIAAAGAEYVKKNFLWGNVFDKIFNIVNRA